MSQPYVTIYKDANYNGDRADVREDIPDLSEWNGDRFHDAISSMVIHSGTWEFWQNIHYSGACYSYSKGKIGFPPKDTISSIRKISDDPQ